MQLTPHEYELLRLLARNEGKLLTHQAILREVWGEAYADESHYLHVYVSQLRRKLEPDPARPRYILTEPGVGYRLVDPLRDFLRRRPRNLEYGLRRAGPTVGAWPHSDAVSTSTCPARDRLRFRSPRSRSPRSRSTPIRGCRGSQASSGAVLFARRRRGAHGRAPGMSSPPSGGPPTG